MKNFAVEKILAKISKDYNDFQKAVDKSLNSFCDEHAALEAFLFRTLLGEIVRKNIAAHIFDYSLKDKKRYIFEKFNIEFKSADEAALVQSLLNDTAFRKYLSRSFSVAISVKRIGSYLQITLES